MANQQPQQNPNNATWAAIVSSQTVNFTDVFGNTQTIPLAIIDYYGYNLGRSLIIFGTNLGMCAMVTIVLLLLTKADKRRTPIFILNIAGLIAQFLRMLLICILYNGATSTFSAAVLGLALLKSTASEDPVYIYTIITIFWYVIIMSSLILQVRVVFGAERTSRKYLTYALGMVGLAAVGFIVTAQADILKGDIALTGARDDWEPWVEMTGRILYTVTIGLSSAIFVGKLIHLIHRRRKMGFNGFGPLQVIVIMGCQCLLVPRIPPLCCVESNK